MIRFFAPLLLAALLVGCGGSGARASVRESYAGNYVLQDGTTGGAVVLDIVAGKKVEGSVAVGGTVYDFAGQIGSDDEMAAEGEKIVVRAHLVRTKGETSTLSGVLSVSGAVSIKDSRTSLVRDDATD